MSNHQPQTEAASSDAWRQWLADHHATEDHVWLIIYKKDSGIPSIAYPEAVDEALCFGWIDSKPNKRDAQSYYQYFSKRNPKSNWSRVNKEKIARLTQANKLAPAGKAMVALAKETGTWTALDAVENLVLPTALRQQLEAAPEAFAQWEAFPRSAKRGILEWIFNAKTEKTKLKRIAETVEKAAQGERANQYRRKK